MLQALPMAILWVNAAQESNLALALLTPGFLIPVFLSSQVCKAWIDPSSNLLEHPDLLPTPSPSSPTLQPQVSSRPSSSSFTPVYSYALFSWPSFASFDGSWSWKLACSQVMESHACSSIRLAATWHYGLSLMSCRVCFRLFLCRCCRSGFLVMTGSCSGSCKHHWVCSELAVTSSFYQNRRFLAPHITWRSKSSTFCEYQSDWLWFYRRCSYFVFLCFYTYHLQVRLQVVRQSQQMLPLLSFGTCGIGRFPKAKLARSYSKDSMVAVGLFVHHSNYELPRRLESKWSLCWHFSSRCLAFLLSIRFSLASLYSSILILSDCGPVALMLQTGCWCPDSNYSLL